MQKDRLRVDAHQRTAAGSAAASAPPRGRRRPGKAQTALGEENRADEAEGSSWGEEGEGAKLGDRRDETERAGEPEEAETAGDESQLRRACWRKGKMRDTKRLSFAGEASRASLRKKTCAISMSSLRDTRKRCRWREKEELREGERRRQQKGERWGNKERRRKTAKEERGRRTKTREQGTLFYFRRRSLAAFHRPKNFALTLVSCLCSRPDARLASEKKTEKAERGHTMSLNLQERQAAALQAMLALVPQRASSAFTQTDAALPQASTAWKILIFDSAAKDILAPLMTVGMLRRQGVTLHLPLKSRRSPVVEAPAVYLVSPTEENVQLLLEELHQKLYAFYFFNFTDRLPEDLMQLLARGAVEAGMVSQVVSVVDRYVDYVCLSPSEFSLNKPGIYSVLNGNSSDAQIEEAMTAAVNSLFGVIATFGVVPFIRCPASPSSPARNVAMKLQERLATLPHHVHTQIFGNSSSALHRPLLILVDREIDLAVMVRHTWLYQPLLHDLLGLRLNRVSVPVDTKEAAAALRPPRVKTYDLEARDQFWQEHCGSAFPDAALAVSDSLAAYNAKLQEINSQQGGVGSTDPDAFDASGSAQGILTAVSALPGLTEKKRSLDTHTSLATALVDHIKARGLDSFFETEQNFDTDRDPDAVSNAKKLIARTSPGTAVDKLRLLVALFLSRPSLPPQQIRQLEEFLRQETGGVSTAALDFLRMQQSFRTLQTATQSSQNGGSGPGGAGSLAGPGSVGSAAQAAAATLGTKFFDKGRGLLMGVRNLLPVKKTLPLAQVVSTLMENKEDSNFLYVDPRRDAASGRISAGAAPVALRAPFRQAIVFVVGGGSFVEAAALRELAQKTQRQILYGTTDFVSPSDFLEELTRLGGGTGLSGGVPDAGTAS
ncbi:Sec1 family protein [Toxoplasma gondii]|uniref:Sec1 family protein n=1 Tax=Toxoplasma gondii TaxID=5811 RepID=A0A7J6KAB0_TOXGO|nr:Sec1 family protein [Toxoplasma gondii]